MDPGLATLFSLYQLRKGYEGALEGNKAPHVPFPAGMMRMLLTADAANDRQNVPIVLEDTVDDKKLHKFSALVEKLRSPDNLPSEGTIRTQVLTKISAHYTLTDFEIYADGSMSAMVLDPGNDSRAAFVLMALHNAEIPTSMIAGNRSTLETLQTDSSSCGLHCNALAKTALEFPNFHAMTPKYIDGHEISGWNNLPLDFSKTAQRSIESLSTFAKNHPATEGMNADQFLNSLNSESVTFTRNNQSITKESNTALFRNEFSQVENTLIEFIQNKSTQQLTHIAEGTTPTIAENNGDFKKRFQANHQEATQSPTRFSEMSDKQKAVFCQELEAICRGESDAPAKALAHHQELEALFKSVYPDAENFSADAEKFAQYLTEHGFDDYSALVSQYADNQLDDEEYQQEKAFNDFMKDQNQVDQSEIQDYLRENNSELAEALEQTLAQPTENQMTAR